MILTESQNKISYYFALSFVAIIFIEFVFFANTLDENRKGLLFLGPQLAFSFFIIHFTKSNKGKNYYIISTFLVLYIIPVVTYVLSVRQYDKITISTAILIFTNLASPFAFFFFLPINSKRTPEKDSEDEKIPIGKALLAYALQTKSSYIDSEKLRKSIFPNQRHGYIQGFIEGITFSSYYYCIQKYTPDEEKFTECIYSDFRFIYGTTPEELTAKFMLLREADENKLIDSGSLAIIAALRGSSPMADLLLHVIRNAVGKKFSEDL